MPAARKSTARSAARKSTARSAARKTTTTSTARKSTGASRRTSSFKEPAALKQLNRSLESATKAMTELRKHTGRDVSQGARDVYKDLRTFVSSAQRDTRKLGKALARDFDQAQKGLAKSRATGKSRTRATGSARKSRPAASRRRSSSSR